MLRPLYLIYLSANAHVVNQKQSRLEPIVLVILRDDFTDHLDVVEERRLLVLFVSVLLLQASEHLNILGTSVSKTISIAEPILAERSFQTLRQLLLENILIEKFEGELEQLFPWEESELARPLPLLLTVLAILLH